MPAIAGLAAVDVIVVALVALILALAFFQLYRPLVLQGLSSVPLIGGWLAQNADLVLLRGFVQALVWAAQAAQPLADAIQAVHVVLGLYAQSVVELGEAQLLALWRLRFVTLPATVASLIGYAQGLYAQALAYAQGLYVRALAYVDTRVAQLTAYAQALYVRALSYIDARAAQLAAYAQQLGAQELAYAQQLDARELAYTRAAVVAVEGYAQQLAGEQLAYTRAAVLGAEQDSRQLVLEGEEYARALQRQALGYVDQVGAFTAATAAAATAVVGARVTAIEDSPCQQFCNPLGDLGGLLQDLEDAGLIAALLALVAEAIHDPQQLQEEMRGELLPLVQGALGALGALGLGR